MWEYGVHVPLDEGRVHPFVECESSQEALPGSGFPNLFGDNQRDYDEMTRCGFGDCPTIWLEIRGVPLLKASSTMPATISSPPPAMSGTCQTFTQLYPSNVWLGPAQRNVVMTTAPPKNTVRPAAVSAEPLSTVDPSSPLFRQIGGKRNSRKTSKVKMVTYRRMLVGAAPPRKRRDANIWTPAATMPTTSVTNAAP